MTTPEHPPRPSSPLGVFLGVLTIALPFVLMMVSPVGCDRMTDGYTLGMQRLHDCPAAGEALGAPIDKTWGWSNYAVERAGSTGTAHYEMTVAGTRQRATYEFGLSRDVHGWRLEQAHLLLGDRRILDVLHCGTVAPVPTVSAMLPAPPPPGLSGAQTADFYCRNGLPSVCVAASLVHSQGVGVPVDRARAAELLDIGCRAGQADACAERQRLGTP